LDQAIDVRGFPFEFAVGVVGGTDVGVEEEVASGFVGPVGWDGEFGFAGFGGGDEGFDCAVFFD